MTTLETSDVVRVVCPCCGEEVDRAVRIRAQYVGSPTETAETPMCVSCALGWPGALTFIAAGKDGTLTFRHHSVIGEWMPDQQAIDRANDPRWDKEKMLAELDAAEAAEGTPGAP